MDESQPVQNRWQFPRKCWKERKAVSVEVLAQILEQAPSVLRAVAPDDFGQTPIYVALQSWMPTPIHDAVAGFVAVDLDLVARPFLPRWQGRGHCIMFNDAIAKRDYGNDSHLTGLEAKRVICHEAAHLLDVAMPCQESFITADGAQATQTAALIAKKFNPNLPDPIEERPQPCPVHALTFIRAALHVEFRAKRQGWDIHGWNIVSTGEYGLAPMRVYRAALGDEPSKLLGLSFKQIHETPLPREFLTFAADNVSRWLRCQPDVRAAARLASQFLNRF